MKANRHVLAVLIMLTLIVPLIGSDAIGTGTSKPMTITIDFGGLCDPISSSPPNTDPAATVTLNLPQRCPATGSDYYTFAAAGGTAAQVVAAPDNGSDTLSLLTVKITRTGSPADLHMTFSANNFEAPPTNAASNTGYKIEGTGYWNNKLTYAPGSNLIFEGWVDDTPLHGLGYTPPTSVAVPVGVDGGTVKTFSGKYAGSVWSPGTLGTPRTLKGELWVHLAQPTHSLTLSTLSVHDYLPNTPKCKPKAGKLRECRNQGISS